MQLFTCFFRCYCHCHCFSCLICQLPVLLTVLIDITTIVMLDIFGDGPRPIAWNPSDGMWYCKAPMFTTGVATSWGSPPTGFDDLTFQSGCSGDQPVHTRFSLSHFLPISISFSIYLPINQYRQQIFSHFSATHRHIYTHRWP